MTFARFDVRPFLSDSHDPSRSSRFSSPAPLDMNSGYELHRVSAVEVEERWTEDTQRGAPCRHCACCDGPAQQADLTCRSCSDLTPARMRELTASPPCARCGGRGDTSDGSRYRYCEACRDAALDSDAADARSPLLDAVQEIAPAIRLTVTESSDVARDVWFLRRIRRLLEEFAGRNLVLMRIVTLNGRRPLLRWYALACPELRVALARLLAERAVDQEERRPRSAQSRGRSAELVNGDAPHL